MLIVLRGLLQVPRSIEGCLIPLVVLVNVEVDLEVIRVSGARLLGSRHSRVDIPARLQVNDFNARQHFMLAEELLQDESIDSIVRATMEEVAARVHPHDARLSIPVGHQRASGKPGNSTDLVPHETDVLRLLRLDLVHVAIRHHDPVLIHSPDLDLPGNAAVQVAPVGLPHSNAGEPRLRQLHCRHIGARIGIYIYIYIYGSVPN